MDELLERVRAFIQFIPPLARPFVAIVPLFVILHAVWTIGVGDVASTPPNTGTTAPVATHAAEGTSMRERRPNPDAPPSPQPVAADPSSWPVSPDTVLNAIQNAPEFRTPKSVTCAKVPDAATARICDALISLGYAEKKLDPSGSQKEIVMLTEAGQTALGSSLSENANGYTISVAERRASRVTKEEKLGAEPVSVSVVFEWYWVSTNMLGAALIGAPTTYSGTAVMQQLTDGWHAVRVTVPDRI